MPLDYKSVVCLAIARSRSGVLDDASMVYHLIANADWTQVCTNINKWQQVYIKSYTALGALSSSVVVSPSEPLSEELELIRQDMIVRLAESFGSLPRDVEALGITLGGFQHHWLEILDMVLCGVHLKIINTKQVLTEFQEEANFEVGIRGFGRDSDKLLLSPDSWADLQSIMATIDYDTRWTAVQENGIEDLVRPYSVVGTTPAVGAKWCRLIYLWSVVPACAAGLLHSGLSLQPEQAVSVDDDTESEEADQAADGAVQIGIIPLDRLADSQASLDRAAALLQSPPGSITTNFVGGEVVHSAKGTRI